VGSLGFNPGGGLFVEVFAWRIGDCQHVLIFL
jgi:hypothetical protein